MSTLITGGAGYIGSHAAREMLERGRDVVVYDNLVKGHRAAVKDCPLIVGDIFDQKLLRETIEKYHVENVIHFAAFSLVGESMVDPQKYYYNNLAGTLSLLTAMKDTGVKHIVFSSTAATYGEPEIVPITEDCPQHPTNVYGRTKLMMEKMIADFDMAYGMKFIALRYFNVAGAHRSGEIGEDHSPESHLLPIIFQVLNGKREKLMVFGDDYPTTDGSCIRDYIHVTDLADAHILALDRLGETNTSDAFNLGNGSGFSVLEVIRCVERVTGKKVPYEIAPRRAGDPAVLIAGSDKAHATLGWNPR